MFFLYTHMDQIVALILMANNGEVFFFLFWLVNIEATACKILKIVSVLVVVNAIKYCYVVVIYANQIV